MPQQVPPQISTELVSRSLFRTELRRLVLLTHLAHATGNDHGGKEYNDRGKSCTCRNSEVRASEKYDEEFEREVSSDT
jgi:hypothetical protein